MIHTCALVQGCSSVCHAYQKPHDTRTHGPHPKVPCNLPREHTRNRPRKQGSHQLLLPQASRMGQQCSPMLSQPRSTQPPPGAMRKARCCGWLARHQRSSLRPGILWLHLPAQQPWQDGCMLVRQSGRSLSAPTSSCLAPVHKAAPSKLGDSTSLQSSFTEREQAAPPSMSHRPPSN